jgi:hypothetical protein
MSFYMVCRAPRETGFLTAMCWSMDLDCTSIDFSQTLTRTCCKFNSNGNSITYGIGNKCDQTVRLFSLYLKT